MNLNNVPSKVEVMGWNPQTLSNYMKRVSSKTAASHYKTCTAVWCYSCLQSNAFLKTKSSKLNSKTKLLDYFQTAM